MVAANFSIYLPSYIYCCTIVHVTKCVKKVLEDEERRQKKRSKRMIKNIKRQRKLEVGEREKERKYK